MPPTPTIDPAAVRFCRREGLAWQLVDGEGLLLDLDARIFRGMNRSAFEVWQQVDGQRSVGEIAEHLALRYGLDSARALADVTAYLNDLHTRGLVIRAS